MLPHFGPFQRVGFALGRLTSAPKLLQYGITSKWWWTD